MQSYIVSYFKDCMLVEMATNTTSLRLFCLFHATQKQQGRRKNKQLSSLIGQRSNATKHDPLDSIF
jgi:hypothetical protein